MDAATADAIARHIPDFLDRAAFSVVLGAEPETTALLEEPWGHIFFTGGTVVAKIVMTTAARSLTSVVLDLGGKSPAVVHSSADLHVAARRIAHGRWNNAGQTCTAPDYVRVINDVGEAGQPAELYRPSARLYQGLQELDYPLHNWTVIVTICGRICFNRRKINLSTVFAGQTVGLRHVGDRIWLVSFMHYDRGYFDDETCRLEPLHNPFGPNVAPMSPV